MMLENDRVYRKNDFFEARVWPLMNAKSVKISKDINVEKKLNNLEKELKYECNTKNIKKMAFRK